MLIRAVNIPPKIKLKEVTRIVPFETIFKSSYEVVFKLGEDSFIIVYSFGAYTLTNVPQVECDIFKKKIREVVGIADEFEVEDIYDMKINRESPIVIEYNSAVLPEFKIEYLRLISLILAESVAIEYFELLTENILSKSLSYSKQLQTKGLFPRNQKELLKFIGFSVTTRQEILSNLYISDAPDETWNNPHLEKLFVELKDMFDIEQRFRSLNMSLNSIQESIEIMVDLLQTRKSQVLETLIIVLIIIEIIISFIELPKISF